MRLQRTLLFCLIGSVCFAVSTATGPAVILAATPEGAAADAKYPVVEVTGDDVNLRAGPSIDHHDVGQLARGALLLELARDDEFVRVRVPGGVPVYVFASLLELADGAAGAGEARDGEQAELPLHCRVNADDVLMRATPTTGHYPVHDQKLSRGDELIVIGAEDTAKGRWLRVIAPPTVHVWIHERYVRRADPQPSPAEVAERAEKRQDELSGGRTRAERERRAAAAEASFSTRLRAITEKVDAGAYGVDVEREARELAAGADDEAQRVTALALAERVVGLREFQKTAREAADAAAAAERQREQDAADRQRRRLEDQRRRQDIERERARLRRERQSDRGRPTAEGVVRIVGSSALLDTTGNSVVELSSTRYRIEDYARKRVKIWGSLQRREGRRDRVEVTSIEIVATDD